jgi:hypothetical protein
MSKYIIRYLLRTRDRQDAHNVTFDAFCFHDALARFSAWQRRLHPFESIDIIAVWSDADCELRARRKGAAA